MTLEKVKDGYGESEYSFVCLNRTNKESGVTYHCSVFSGSHNADVMDFIATKEPNPCDPEGFKFEDTYVLGAMGGEGYELRNAIHSILYEVTLDGYPEAAKDNIFGYVWPVLEFKHTYRLYPPDHDFKEEGLPETWTTVNQ